jgi:hypothetical protein
MTSSLAGFISLGFHGNFQKRWGAFSVATISRCFFGCVLELQCFVFPGDVTFLSAVLYKNSVSA